MSTLTAGNIEGLPNDYRKSFNFGFHWTGWVFYLIYFVNHCVVNIPFYKEHGMKVKTTQPVSGTRCLVNRVKENQIE